MKFKLKNINGRYLIFLKFSIFNAIALTLTGCATNESALQKKQYTPTLNQQQITLLNANGFSSGVWSENCSNLKLSREIISQTQDVFAIAKFYDDKRISYDFIYEVNLVSKGVLQVKTKTADVSDIQSLSSRMSGYLNSKRMTFDYKTLYISGPNSGKEFITIKDGFEVKENPNGSQTKGNISKQLSKCSNS
jgi:hypothetical protein